MNEEIKHVSEVVKDPSSVPLVTYMWVFLLASWGGIVRVFREVKLGDKSWRQIVLIFIAEVATSSFAGVLTFFLCESQNVERLYTAAMTGVAGYMGGRALSVLEAVYKARTSPGANHDADT